MLVWRRWVLPILLVLVLGAAAAALVKLAFFPDRTVAQVVPGTSISDPVIAVERGSVMNELTLQGNIARDDSLAVRSEISGEVIAVHVAEGATVEAGQALVTVRQEWPVVNIDVVAPEAGGVSDLTLVKGQQVSIGAEVAKLSPLRYHLLATVEPVQLYRLVNSPSEAQVTITGGPAPFTCTGVNVQVSQEGTASVRCAVPADQVVFAGLPAQMGLTLGRVDDALVVPVTAVQGGAGSGVVWVENSGGELEERSVSLGINDGVNVEVIEGLAEGDMIRQFVPGFVAPVEEFCYEIAPGQEFCESGMSW